MLGSNTACPNDRVVETLRSAYPPAGACVDRISCCGAETAFGAQGPTVADRGQCIIYGGHECTGTGGLEACRANTGVVLYEDLLLGDHTTACYSNHFSGTAYQCAEGMSFEQIPNASQVNRNFCLSDSYSAAKRACIAGIRARYPGSVETIAAYNDVVADCRNSGGSWSDATCGCSVTVSSCSSVIGTGASASLQCGQIEGCRWENNNCVPTSTGNTNPGQLGSCARCNRNSDCSSGVCQAFPGGYACARPNNGAACTVADIDAATPGSTGPGTSANGTCANGCCSITPAGVAAGCYLGRYTCNNGSIPCNSSDAGVTTEITNGQVCVLSNYCGSQQVDLRCPGLEPLFVTSQANNQCSSPLPSTPVQPSPSTPPQQLSCGSLQMLDETGTTVLTQTPPTGTSVRFRCVPAAGLQTNYYFFAYRDTLPTDPLRLIYEGTSDLTFPIVLQPFMTVQCNPCVAGVGCSDNVSVQNNCTFQIDRRTTSPSPTPSPVGPQCLAITMTNVSNPTAPATADPRLGDAVTFTCGEVAGASRYVFRVQLPNGQVQTLAATGRTSQQLTINEAGRYYAQCQICTGADEASCHAYETLPADQTGGI